MSASRLAIALLWAAAAAAQPAAPLHDESREIFDQIDHALDTLAEISGLHLHHRVAYDLITRDKVNEFLKKRVKESVKPSEIRAEELTLKKFGLVPPDFDLAKTTVELLTEQAAAFYDFNRKKLFITDWTPTATREAALVHELAHALADQSFNLERFIKQGNSNDDAATAHLAVMEGQASWLMSEFLARQTGQSLKDSPALLEMMSRASEVGAGQYPVFEGAPLYLRETLVFPYTRGMLFQHAVCMKLGRTAFAEVFRRAPVSTQQILHPEKYFDGTRPSDPAVPSLQEHGFKRLVEGRVGELDHAILIRQFGGKELADRLAPHWKGGRYALFENQARNRVVLAYAADWDTVEAAAEYFRFYNGALHKKWKKIRVSSESGREVTGEGDDGRFNLRMAGTMVTSLEGQ